MNVHDQMFHRAFQLYQAGEVAQAETLCAQIVRDDPGNGAAWNLLGVIDLQAGNMNAALDKLSRAVTAAPWDAGFRNNRAITLARMGQREAAEQDFRETVRLAPDNAGTNYNHGTILRELGRHEESVSAYRRALELQPNSPEIHNDLGTALWFLGRHEEAAAYYLRALQLRPDYVEGHSNLGNVLRDLRQFEKAVFHCRRALELQPNFADALNNLGGALAELGRYEEAVDCYRRTLELRPDFPKAYNNLGTVLCKLDRFEEAEALSRRALELRPDFAEAHDNLGGVLHQQGRLPEAEASYRRALELKPDFAEAHGHLGLLQLIQGDYEHGWAEYEWRWKTAGFQRVPYPQPLWDGTPLHGRTILLRTEAGFGDTVQFVRFAPLVKELGGNVLVECPAELVRLFRTCAGVDGVVTRGNAPPPFDVQASLMSLSLLLKITLARLPAKVPYLHVDPGVRRRWSDELGTHAEFKVGLFWQGNPWQHDPDFKRMDRKRSASFAHLKSLLELPRIRFFSLQKDFPAEELTRSDVVPLGDRLDDFMETAGVMANLDLVITVDSAPAHLAGALGIPVWTMLPFGGCWRWLLKREDSPWYPTMRLFRQARPGDWDGVLARVSEALAAKVDERS